MSSYNWVQRPTQENKDTNGLAVTTSFPQWVRNPFICHQMIPLQMWEHFLPGKKVLTSLQNHQSDDLSDSHEIPQLHTVEPDLWDPATQGHQKCDSSWGCWMDWLAHQSCDLSHMCQFAPKDCSPCHSDTGFEWIQGGQATWLPHKQLKQTNSGCPW